MDKTIVTFNDEKISVAHPDGMREEVKWAELVRLVVVTTNDGPFNTDVFLVLSGKENLSGCVIPQGSIGDTELLSALQTRLSGFDHQKFIDAMTCTENQTCEIWGFRAE